MLAVTNVIHCDPDILSGEPVFVGTRVLLQNLIDYLAAGDSLETFLDAFPSVTRSQAVAALELAGEALADRAHPNNGLQIDSALLNARCARFYESAATEPKR